jgi:predicted Zn-dependent peptidase
LFTTGDLPEGRAGSMMEDLFLEGTVRSVDEIARGIDGVRIEDIKAYLEQFPPNPVTLATLGPRELKIS